ncbi:MAG: hypothetical protein ACFB10_01000 [Salibacteraceae bacterium]
MRYLVLLLCLCFFKPLAAQSVKQEKMQNLSYLIGEWVGTSTTYKDGKVDQQVPAFEKISYDLNQSILVIELNSATLQLHTIIHYHEKDGTYYYYAFSQNGGGRLPASFVDGHLVVQASETRRYIFEATQDGGFREYGEKLIDGQWVKYFEDVFANTQ